MLTAKAIAAEAEKRMKANAVLVTAVEISEGFAERIQVYFWDEHEAVMDIISKIDLVENWPDDGVYVLDTGAPTVEKAFRELRLIDGEEDFYLRATEGDDVPCDDFGTLPSVLFLESVEAICSLKDKIKI